MRLSRLSITIIFFLHGSLFGNWVTRIPNAKDRLNLSEGQLGLLLLAISSGLIVSIYFTGGLISHFGSDKVTTLSTIVASLLLPLMGTMDSFLTMWMVLFIFGSSMTFMDVAMNAQAVEIEKSQYNQSIMSTFHAAYSIGGFAGAGIGALFIKFEIIPEIHLMIIGLITIVIMFAVQGHFVSDPQKLDQTDSSVFHLPPLALLPLGFIAFISSVGEGAMADWSGLYLLNELQTNATQATLGFASFSIAMTVGRLSGDFITEKITAPLLLRLNAIIAMIGLILLVVSGNLIISIIGFVFTGIGLSCIIPIVFRAAGRFPDYEAGVGIASVSSIGYLGFLIGPPAIGFIAEISSLKVAFFIISILMIGVLIITSKINLHLEHNSKNILN